jgi:hypothetical protein
VASALALVGVTVAACGGPTIIIQNVIGDAGGPTDGKDAGEDAGGDAGSDAGEVITSCVPGTTTAPTTPLYLELSVLQDPRGDVGVAVKRFLNNLTLGNPSLAVGLKTVPDLDLDANTYAALLHAGQAEATMAYEAQLSDFPQLLTAARRTTIGQKLDAALAEAAGFGMEADTGSIAQLRASATPRGVNAGGRRAFLVVSSWRPNVLTRSLYTEATNPVPVLLGSVQLSSVLPWSYANEGRFPAPYKGAGLDGDEHCDDAQATPTSSYGPGKHQLCVPVLVGTKVHGESLKFPPEPILEAMTTVFDELRACEYAVQGFDARFGGRLAVAWKDADGRQYPLAKIAKIDTSSGIPHPAGGMWAEPAGYYFDDPSVPTKVRLTGLACIEMRRDARRTLVLTTTCP